MIARLRYWLLPLAIIVAGGAIMAALIATREDSPRRTPQGQVKLVTTKMVEPTVLTPEIKAFGRVTSAEPVRLISDVTGVLRDGEIPFKPAQAFRKGDLLVRVDDRQVRLELNSRKAELLTALAQLLPELAVEYPDENEEWSEYFNACDFDRPISELPEPANQKIKLYLARFNVYKLYFEVKDLEIELDKHYFRAPFDGSIVATDLRVGSTARQGSTLGEIISLEQLEVEVSLPVEQVPWIDFEQPVRLTSLETAGQWEGEIVRVGSDIETNTQAVPVYVALTGGDRAGLINGTFLTARLSGRTIDSAVAVPRSVIYSDRYVYLLSDGTLQRRDVTIAFNQPNHVIVSEGLHYGDSLVTEILQGVAPGMPAAARSAAEEL